MSAADVRLEQALFELGRQLRWPPGPELASRVRATIEEPSAPARLPVRRPAVRRAVVLAAAVLLLLVGGLALLSPAVRAAILRIFVLPGVRILQEVGEPAPARPLGEGLDLGRRTSLEQAERESGLEVAIPEALGTPDEIYVADVGTERASLAYRARPGLPQARATGLGLLLTEFRATVEEDFVQKLTFEGVRVTDVRVGTAPAFWVEGPHTVILIGEEGIPIQDSARLAGNTLLWSEGGVTYRLEADIPLDRALEIAGSVR
jgi:hypothetical protein